MAPTASTLEGHSRTWLKSDGGGGGGSIGQASVARALGWGDPLICGQRLDSVYDSLSRLFGGALFAVDRTVSWEVEVTVWCRSVIIEGEENKTKEIISLFLLRVLHSIIIA